MLKLIHQIPVDQMMTMWTNEWMIGNMMLIPIMENVSMCWLKQVVCLLVSVVIVVAHDRNELETVQSMLAEKMSVTMTAGGETMMIESTSVEVQRPMRLERVEVRRRREDEQETGQVMLAEKMAVWAA